MAEGEKSPVQPNLTKMRDDECIPIARELLKRIANRDDLLIGSTETYTEAEALEYYNTLYSEEVAPYLVEKNVRVKDVTFIFQIMAQAVQLLQSRTEMTVDMRYDQAVAKALGADSADDVRIAEIQAQLVEKTEADNEK